MQILKDQQKGPVRSHCFQGIADFAQHAVTTWSWIASMRDLTVLSFERERELCQPSGSLNGQDFRLCAARGGSAQVPERLQHGIVGFNSTIDLNALTSCHPQLGSGLHSLPDKLIHQRRLANSALARDKDDLAQAAEAVAGHW